MNTARPTSTPRAPASYKRDVAQRIAVAMRSAGIDFVVLLPDSVLHGVHHELMHDDEVTSVVCAREDEGIAIAMGASWTGRGAAVLMEGSGLGYSSLILARGIVQKSPVLLVASHNSVLGERFHYHAATRLVTEPVLTALNIPYHVLTNEAEIETVFREISNTMRGQRTPAAVLVPRYLCVAG